MEPAHLHNNNRWLVQLLQSKKAGGLHPYTTVVLAESEAWLPQLVPFFDKTTLKSDGRYFIRGVETAGKHILLTGPCNSPADADALLQAIKEAGITKILRLGSGTALLPSQPNVSVTIPSFAIGLDNTMQFYRYGENTDEAFILDAFRQHARIDNSTLRPYVAEGSISLRKYFGNGYVHSLVVSLPTPMVISNPGAAAVYPYLQDALRSFSSRNLAVTIADSCTAPYYALGRLLGLQCVSVIIPSDSPGPAMEQLMPVIADMA